MCPKLKPSHRAFEEIMRRSAAAGAAGYAAAAVMIVLLQSETRAAVAQQADAVCSSGTTGTAGGCSCGCGSFRVPAAKEGFYRCVVVDAGLSALFEEGCWKHGVADG